MMMMMMIIVIVITVIVIVIVIVIVVIVLIIVMIIILITITITTKRRLVRGIPTGHAARSGPSRPHQTPQHQHQRPPPHLMTCSLSTCMNTRDANRSLLHEHMRCRPICPVSSFK